MQIFFKLNVEESGCQVQRIPPNLDHVQMSALSCPCFCLEGANTTTSCVQIKRCPAGTYCFVPWVKNEIGGWGGISPSR